MPNTQAYWDGQQWTENYAPLPPRPVEPPHTNLVIAGWLLAFFVPVVGFVIGCVLLGKRAGHGVGVMLLSLVAAGMWYSTFMNLYG